MLGFLPSVVSLFEKRNRRHIFPTSITGIVIHSLFIPQYRSECSAFDFEFGPYHFAGCHLFCCCCCCRRCYDIIYPYLFQHNFVFVFILCCSAYHALRGRFYFVLLLLSFHFCRCCLCGVALDPAPGPGTATPGSGVGAPARTPAVAAPALGHARLFTRHGDAGPATKTLAPDLMVLLLPLASRLCSLSQVNSYFNSYLTLLVQSCVSETNLFEFFFFFFFFLIN